MTRRRGGVSLLDTLAQFTLQAIPWVVVSAVVAILFIGQSYNEQRVTFLSNQLHRQNSEYVADTTKMVNSSVTIVAKNTILGGGGLGSGTVIKKTFNTTYILTCAHVVAASEDFTAEPDMSINKLEVKYTINGKETAYEAFLVKYDSANDIALIKINTNDSRLEVAPIAYFEPEQGDVIYVVGNPLSHERNLSKGIISSLREKGFYVTDALTTFGNSGGSLFNVKGELIGIPESVSGYGGGLFGGGTPESNLGRCITLPLIQAFLEDVRY
jgi:S1-C subfamily serine protease